LKTHWSGSVVILKADEGVGRGPGVRPTLRQKDWGL